VQSSVSRPVQVLKRSGSSNAKKKEKKSCFEELNVISGWLQAAPGAYKNFMETYVAFLKNLKCKL
jgi:hypothetical protein